MIDEYVVNIFFQTKQNKQNQITVKKRNKFKTKNQKEE
jgi:hypothetical protein